MTTVEELPDVPVIPYTALDPRLVAPHALAAVDGAVSYLNLAITHTKGYRPLRVDVHVPATGAGPFPVVVYAHGGAFVGGIKEIGPWGALPANGIAVVSVEYRLAGEAKFPAAIRDVEAALHWVRQSGAELNLDPSRVAMWGSSAGGYLIAGALVGLGDPDPAPSVTALRESVSAVVLHYAPVDFREILHLWREAQPDRADRVHASMQAIFRQSFPSGSDVPDTYSVVEALRRHHRLPPFHLAHGEADTVVPVEQSILLRDVLRTLGVPVDLHVIAGADHGAPPFSEWGVVGPAVEFLRTVWGPTSQPDSTRG